MSSHPLPAEEPLSPPLPPAVSLQSGRGEQKPFFSSGERRVSCLSFTDLRVTGEDEAVRMESGSVDVRGETCEVALRLQSRGLLHDIWVLFTPISVVFSALREIYAK